MLLVEAFVKNPFDLSRVLYRAIQGWKGTFMQVDPAYEKNDSTFRQLLQMVYSQKDAPEGRLAMVYAALIRSQMSDKPAKGTTETRFEQVLKERLKGKDGKDGPTVQLALAKLIADTDANKTPIPFSSLTIKSFFDNVIRGSAAAERVARELYMALQKKKVLGRADLWFLQDDDSEYVTEIERTLRRRVDRLRLDDEKSRTFLAGAGTVTGKWSGTPLEWEARFGKRGLIAIVRTEDAPPEEQSARANGLNPVDGTQKWEVVVTPTKNLPAEDGGSTADAVMLKQAKLQFRDAILRMKVAFRRGDFYFAIDRLEPAAAAAPEAAAAAAPPPAEARPAARGSPVTVTASTQAAAASLDELFASHAAATRRVLELLEDV